MYDGKMNEKPLEGKVSLVTGGAGGIGSKVSEKLAELGSTVYVNDVKGARELVDKINNEYSDTLAVSAEADISDKSQVRNMFDEVREEKGGVDILMNIAAVYGPREDRRFHKISYEDFKRTIDIDLCGAVYCTIAALKQMKESGWGKIMYTGAPMSSSGITSPYCAGKAGFIGLAKYISQKYGDRGINGYALAIRHVETPMIRSVLESRVDDVEEGLKSMNEESLTGRMITPEEIADILAYFAQPQTDDLNGQAVLADGGITYLR